MVANVIIDLEPFFVLLLGLDYPLHGFFHSFLGGSVAAIILSLVVIGINGKAREVMRFFRLGQKQSQRGIWLASFLGIYLHIFLDSFLYADIRPFFPLDINPFYTSQIFGGFEIYGLCIILFIFGIALYAYKMLKH